jgi:hypothetical protein
MKVEELANLLQNGEEPIAKETRKVRRFVNRRFMLTPYRIRVVRGRAYSKRMTPMEVNANEKNKTILNLRRQGFARVDCIEIETSVNEYVGKEIQKRRMNFAEQIFLAAKNKTTPKPIEIIRKDTTQATIPWELLDSGDNAYLSDKPVVKVADRKAKTRAENKRYELFNRLNKIANEADRMQIFDRESGGFLFGSINEDDIVNFIADNNLALEDIIVYVSNETYWELRGME